MSLTRSWRGVRANVCGVGNRVSQFWKVWVSSVVVEDVVDGPHKKGDDLSGCPHIVSEEVDVVEGAAHNLSPMLGKALDLRLLL
jgi:hypothetical protein